MASVQTSSYNGRYLKLTVEETSYSIENNTSTITWTLESIGGSSNYYNIYEAKVTINDVVKYGPTTKAWDTKVFPAAKGSTSGTIVIPHNPDGSVSDVTFVLRGSVFNNSPQNYSGTLSLTTIPRASSFTISKTSGGSVASSFTLGEDIYVNITRANSSFTHKVYFVVGSSGNQTLSNSATTSASGTLALSLANYIPTTSSTAIMYVETYNNGTLIGSASQTFTLNVPSSVVPTISSVTTSDTQGRLSVFGAYVQGKSTLRIQTSASGVYGSSIQLYSIQIKSGNTVLQTLSGADVSLTNISYTGNLTVSVTVTDSRGRTATYITSITVLAYSNPQINTFTITRDSSTPTNVSVTINASIVALNNHNTKSFTLKYKKTSDSSWTSVTLSNSNYTLNTTHSLSNIDENSSYDFQLIVADYFTSNTRETDLGTVFELINWKSDGTAMALGKVSELSNTFECALNTKFYEDVDITGNTNVDGNLTINGNAYVNGKQLIGAYNLDLSSLSTSNFYPVTFYCGSDILDCEIHSRGFGSTEPYNQNVIHYRQMAAGWSDTPSALEILMYNNFDNSEITIGCIGFGNSSAYEHVVWLRGGLPYVIYSNFEPWLHTTDYTTSGGSSSTFTVGTNYYGGSNTRVSIRFTPQETIINGAYFPNDLCASGYINNRMCWTDSTTNSLANFKNHVLSNSVKTGTTVISCIFNGQYLTAIVEKANSNYASFLLFNYGQLKHYRYYNGTWYDETILKDNDITYGSNANGSWTKYPDGTMICYQRFTITTAVNINWGQLKVSETQTPPDFPVAFTTVPSVNITAEGSLSVFVINGSTNTTKTKATSFNLAGAVAINSTTYTISITAIGRWK